MIRANIHATLGAFLFLSPIPFATYGASTGKPVMPPPAVHLIEDHSQLVPLCVRNGLRNVTILHIDARDDLWPPPTDDQVRAAKTLLESGKLDELDTSGRYYTPWKDRLYDISNHLILAHRLGILRNVYWAIPTFGSMDNASLSDLKKLLYGTRKFDPSEVDRLRIDPPNIKGTLSGVPVTIGSLKDFPPPESAWVLGIDLGFFPALYKNPVASSYSGLLAAFAEWLRKRPPPAPSLAVIAWSNNGDHLPISLRFLGRWLRELLEHPALLEAPPPKTWALKEEALHLEYFEQYDEAKSTYLAILRERPDDPDAHYSLGMLLLGEGDIDAAIGSLSRAYRFDRAYIAGFVKAANLLERSGRPNDSLKVLNAAASLSPGHVLLLDALGTHFHIRGDYTAAIRYYRKVIDLGRPSPLTHAYLGDSHLLSGNPVDAETEYIAAIRLHREHPGTELSPRYWLSLGEVRETLKKPAEARATYLELLGRPSLDVETERIVKDRLERIPLLPTSP